MICLRIIFFFHLTETAYYLHHFIWIKIQNWYRDSSFCLKFYCSSRERQHVTWIDKRRRSHSTHTSFTFKVRLRRRCNSSEGKKTDIKSSIPEVREQTRSRIHSWVPRKVRHFRSLRDKLLMLFFPHTDAELAPFWPHQEKLLSHSVSSLNHLFEFFVVRRVLPSFILTICQFLQICFPTQYLSCSTASITSRSKRCISRQ